MPSYDHNVVFLLAAFVITWAVLGGYLLYLRSRLSGLRRRAAAGPGRGQAGQPAADAHGVGASGSRT